MSMRAQRRRDRDETVQKRQRVCFERLLSEVSVTHYDFFEEEQEPIVNAIRGSLLDENVRKILFERFDPSI